MPLRASDARIVLRRLLLEGTFVVSSHARQEMTKDRLDDLDVVNILRAGVVQPAEWEGGSWRYRVQTRQIVVVAASDPEIDIAPTAEDPVEDMELIVVTAWRLK